MSCHNCTRKTFALFIRSLTTIEPAFAPHHPLDKPLQASRFYSALRQPRVERRTKAAEFDEVEDSFEPASPRRDGRPLWAIQKEALKEKLGGQAWNPRKKLSPDTMEGIRHLHQTQPDKFTTPVLAEHFKVSPEAIRRILKSKWQPTDAEYEARMLRWDKRGERIWSNLVEMGVKPPKRWRDMGVGRAQNGEKPRWKSRSRNMVDVRDSVSEDVLVHHPNDDIIPTVDAKGNGRAAPSLPIFDRL